MTTESAPLRGVVGLPYYLFKVAFVHRISVHIIVCLWQVVKWRGCDGSYAVLQPLTSCSATLTVLHCKPSCSDDDTSLLADSTTDSSSHDRSRTLEFISSVLCKMPVLSCNQGMPYVPTCTILYHQTLYLTHFLCLQKMKCICSFLNVVV